MSPNGVSIMEEVIAKGDLSKLSAEQRAVYYGEVCRSIGVNPLTKPFDYITLNGKLTLYATKTATDQLRTVKGVSIFKVDAITDGDFRIVHAYARDAAGREDMDLGVVNIKGLAGEALANAYMKALTKAKRRVTLSICGLGWLDESEIDFVPSARPIHVDVSTGEIIDTNPDTASHAPESPQSDGMITPKQLAYIGVLKGKKGLTDAGVKALHGKPSAKLLTIGEAKRLIDEILSYPDIVIDEPDGDEVVFGGTMFDEPMANPDRFTS
jgi:hypothetical protein